MRPAPAGDALEMQFDESPRHAEFVQAALDCRDVCERGPLPRLTLKLCAVARLRQRRVDLVAGQRVARVQRPCHAQDRAPAPGAISAAG